MPPSLLYFKYTRKGGKFMDKDSFVISLEEDGFSEEEAELIVDDWIHQSENDD